MRKGKTDSYMPDYKKILHEYWGYEDFRGIQSEIIESIGSGRDTLGLMPTGGGKSLTFQVPALTKPGLCIVITPLIALMKDQVEHLVRKGIRAEAIYSGMTRDEIVKTLENCIFGNIKFLYISPERLASQIFQVKVKKMRVSFITVDEAHCISQWGYDFRPSYLEIANIRKLIPQAPVLALTATATPEVIDDIQDRLGFKEKNVFRMSFARSNLSYVVRTATDKHAELIHILKIMKSCSIVYVRSRKRAKETAELLNNNGLNATFYHAGLEPAVKDQRQKDWQSDQTQIMVATNAFGMGIDKPDVRVVVHIDCPSSIEAYFQEAGRAGRDGRKSYAVMLCNNSDEHKLKKRIEDTFPPKEYVRDVYEHLAYFFQVGLGSGYGATFEFSIERFCITYKYYPIRVNAALAILQRAGYIEYEQNPDTCARVKFILTRNELYRLDEAAGDEDAVITALLRCYGGLFVDFVYIDESLVALKAGMSKEQTYQTLKVLHKKRIIDFIPRKNIPFITYTQDRVNGEDVIISEDVYEKRREQFEKRINAIIDYTRTDYICRSRQLLRYFGETKSEDCGGCDVCLSHSADYPPTDKVNACCEQIMNILADKEKHHITEMRSIMMDSDVVDAALHHLIAEEKIFISGSNLFINT